MKHDSKLLWTNFKKSLSDNLKTIGVGGFKEILFSDKKTRTTFYKNKLFPIIAENLSLILDKKEYLTVDAVFYEKKEETTFNYEIPIIFIESENDIETTYDHRNNEVSKLCTLNAPLKVLFTYSHNWDIDTSNEYSKETWQFPIKAFTKVSILVGYFGIVVAEPKEDKFLFHTFVYDESGDIIDEEVIQI